MDSNQFREKLLIKRPRYNKRYDLLIKKLANKGTTKSEYSQFGPIYEIFIYCFMIGLKSQRRIPLPERKLTADFLEIGKWKRESPIVDFLLSIVLTKSEELSFDWNSMEDMEDNDLSQCIDKIISFIEEYANGGFQLLEELYEKPEYAESHYIFMDIYRKVVEGELE